jgi:hypothetical protein
MEELVGGSGRNLWGTKAHLDGDKGVLESSRDWRIAEVHELCFSNCTVVWLV